MATPKEDNTAVPLLDSDSSTSSSSSLALDPPTHKPIYCNKLNALVFVLYAFCSSAAVSSAIALAPKIAEALTAEGQANDGMETSTFVTTVAGIAVFGTAVGKLLNGFVGDAFGARRVISVYFLFLSASLMVSSRCLTVYAVGLSYSAVEFS
jgi:MFS family permease